MARIVKSLTAQQVDKARAKEKVYKLSDGGGLLLRVATTGLKTWIFNYRHPLTNKRLDYRIGIYPDLTLANAREIHNELKTLVAKGLCPKEERALRKSAAIEQHSNTFEKIAADWFKVKKTTVSKSYADDVWRSLEIHFLPKLGKVAIAAITAPKAIEVIQPLAKKGNFETVKRVCQRVNEIMTFAVNTGVIFANPLSGIYSAFQKPVVKNFSTIQPNELPELMQSLSSASIKVITRCLIEWQLRTMVRPQEAAAARWKEINFEDSTWLIPASRMKKKRDHVVPLTEQTLSLLEYLKPISGHREYIFPADRDPRSHSNSQTANAALKRMGFKDRLVAHGMRALASTTLNEQGFNPDVIESALAHEDKNTVRATYNRAEYIEQRRKMMQWWCDHIDQAATGSYSMAGKKGLKVVCND